MTEIAIKTMGDGIKLGIENSRKYVSEARDLIKKGSEANNQGAVEAGNHALNNGLLGQDEYFKAQNIFSSASGSISEQNAIDIQKHNRSGFNYLAKCELGLKKATEALEA